MAAVHIRNVPDETLALLKARAARNRRSLEGELRIVLDEAAAAASDRPDVAFSSTLVLSYATQQPREWSRDDAYGYDDAGATEGAHA